MAVSSVLEANDGESNNGAGGNGIRAKLARGRKRLIGQNAGGDDRWWTKATRNIVRRFPQFAALSDRFRVFISTRLCQSVRRRHNSQMRASKRAERQIRRFVPVLLVLSVFVYVLLGAAAFLFFEHTNHEQSVRNWFFELIANRHKFARQISSAIFNGTRNMLVIVDYDSSERIQRDLVHLLSQYERKLSLRMPDLNEWTLENSLAYAWGLLTTIGHGHRAPKTRGGQLFALFYCLLGVPFFVVTLLVVSHRIFELCRVGLHFFEQKLNHPLAHRHLLLMLLVLGLHTLWLLLFSFILYGNAISESYWRSLYTAVLSSLTIQSADYNALSERHKLLCLGGATLSLLHSFVAILSLTGAYRRKSRSGGAVAETTLAVPTEEGAPKRRGSAGGGGSLSTNATQPTFHMTVVDESGETKLVLASPDSIDAKNCSGNER
uniref:Potassium channel domain-containing protein n=1 Tax=Globodera rostochiensis TaxID=31243 RepID=A0A914HNX6_GLORO